QMPNRRLRQRYVEVDSRVASRAINGLSRRGMHGAAIKVSRAPAFIGAFGSFALANALYRAGYYVEAFAEFARAYRAHPESSVVSRRLTTAALKSGDLNLQKRGADLLMSVGRPAGEELTKLGKAIDAELGFDAAEKYYWHAFTEWSNGDAHSAIIAGLRREGAHQWRILQVMEAGEELHGDDVDWTVALSSELASAGRFAEATSRYAVVADRLTAEQHYSFGYFFFCAEDFVSARMAFSRAIRLDSDHDAKKFGIGIFHEKY